MEVIKDSINSCQLLTDEGRFSMPKKQKTKNTVIDGKDICRIIPFKPSDGKYEIKIDFGQRV